MDDSFGAFRALFVAIPDAAAPRFPSPHPSPTTHPPTHPRQPTHSQTELGGGGTGAPGALGGAADPETTRLREIDESLARFADVAEKFSLAAVAGGSSRAHVAAAQRFHEVLAELRAE
jgi:hypothetical protein